MDAVAAEVRCVGCGCDGQLYDPWAKLCFHCRQAKLDAHRKALLAKPGPVLMRFSMCGPCTHEGKVVRETAKFFVLADVHNPDAKERRLMKGSSLVHELGCPHCPGSDYARNWQD